MKVALVHDLLVSYGGSEQVLYELHTMFPDAPIYTTMYDPSRLPPRFANLPVRTSFLQHTPGASRHYAATVPLMRSAFRSFDLSGFDLVLSNAHAFAKAVRIPPGAVHVCYCYTPLRYAWSHQREYLSTLPARPALEPAARGVLSVLRRWDLAASRTVHRFIAISEYVRQRIKRYYERDADVVYPPVDINRFQPSTSKPGDAILVVSRLFAYKRVDAAVEACTRLRLPLRVVGRGPELRRLRAMAGPSVTFLGEIDDRALEEEYRGCRMLLFTSDEDFGLTPLEAMASGRPVLALDRGGARETVRPGVTGQLYADAGVDALMEALQKFRESDYDARACVARASEFSPERFRTGIREVLEREVAASRPRGDTAPRR